MEAVETILSVFQAMLEAYCDLCDVWFRLEFMHRSTEEAADWSTQYSSNFNRATSPSLDIDELRCQYKDTGKLSPRLLSYLY
jgi:hypothetical protein